MLKKECFTNGALNKPFKYWAVTRGGSIILQSQKVIYIYAKDLFQKDWSKYVEKDNRFNREIKAEFVYAYKQAVHNKFGLKIYRKL